MSDQGHPGVNTMLAGLSVLLLTGVGLSLLVSRRFEFSAHKREAERALDTHEDRRLELRHHHARLQEEFAAAATLARVQDKELRELRARIQAGEARLPVLHARVAALTDDCDRLANAFARHRADYRNEAWLRAAGERIGDLTLRNGRRFTGVTIVRVTAAGLEIAHADGRARLRGEELDAAWEERFQWRGKAPHFHP